MDTITVLQVFLGKWKSHTRMAQPSEKEENGLSMLLASGFLQGWTAKHESGRWGLHQ